MPTFFKYIAGRFLGPFVMLQAAGQFAATVPRIPAENPRNWLLEAPFEPLRVTAQRIGFHIGTAVKLSALEGSKKYRTALRREFNMVTAENAMKWIYLQPKRGTFNFARADELVKFAEANGMEVRGHTLVWQGQVPKWVSNEDLTADELRAIMVEHIRTVVGHFRGKVKYWDVVNEATSWFGGLRDTFWHKKLGDGYIELAFRTAHAADPDARLFYNDFMAEDLNRKSDAVFKLVTDLLAKGVPIHGVGLQAHLMLKVPDREALQANIQRLADLGLEVHLTEVDAGIREPITRKKKIAQAILYRRLLDACLNVSACTSMVLWGFTDRFTWIDYFPGYSEPLPFDRKLNKRLPWYALSERLDKGRPAPVPKNRGEEILPIMDQAGE